MELTVIIPSLNPDEKLLTVLAALRAKGYKDIILVNDGSDALHSAVFDRAREEYACTVLIHDSNKGKGRALKTALRHYLESGRTTPGIITVDGDNQHHADDIAACEEALLAGNGEKIILGCRDFSLPEVPPKSRFGNRTTSFVFRHFCGLKISDTQTGLRAIPRKYIPLLLETAGDRFEYETNMLLEMKQRSIPFKEVKIRTIYINENETTHFNPISDSLRIYSVILKFMFSSAASFLIDNGLFNLFKYLLLTSIPASWRIFASNVGARIFSSLFNYTINKKTVFRNKCSISGTLFRYYLLAVCILGASTLSLLLLSKLFGDKYTSLFKIFVDTLLYIISFRIQHNWVFKKQASEDVYNNVFPADE